MTRLLIHSSIEWLPHWIGQQLDGILIWELIALCRLRRSLFFPDAGGVLRAGSVRVSFSDDASSPTVTARSMSMNTALVYNSK